MVPSYVRKGPSKFLRDRVIRLGLPALLFVFVIAPPLVHFTYAGPGSFADTLNWYLPHPSRWDTGPMWFTLGLLIITLIWMAFERLRGPVQPKPKVPLKQWYLVALAIVMGFGSFIVRFWFPIGTDVWNFQLCFFAQYSALFVFGILAFKNGWLESIDSKFIKPWTVTLITLVMLGPVLVMGGGALGDAGLDPFYGGLTWQAFAFSFWFEAYCVAMVVTLLSLFKNRMNRQGAVARFATDNAFAVYVFHAPVVVGLAMLMSSLVAPVLLKFVLLSAGSVLIVFPLAGFVLRKIPFLNKIL